ncbi:MAG TPA: hypothetical protein VFC73_09595 [Syntrophomonadaceae bacterium]|nr:hypothetical protein [Syntrophomonadaceae bacterium]
MSGGGEWVQKGDIFSAKKILASLKPYAAKEARLRCELLRKTPRLSGVTLTVYRGLKCVLSGNLALLTAT